MTKPDNGDMVHRMSGKPDRLAVLSRAHELISERGWTASWSINETGPLNLRCSVAKACTELLGQGQDGAADWYELYLDAVHAITTYLESGITDWEFTAKAVQVNTMLAGVINRVENDDIEYRAGRRSNRHPAGL